jgi:hypothetical protein
MSAYRAGVAISLLFGLVAPAYADEPAAPGAPGGVEKTGDAKGAGESVEKEGEEKKGITYWAELTGASSYVWRGERLSVGNPSPTVQPEAEINVPGVGPGTIVANLWMNYALTGDGTGLPNSHLELDPQVAYELPISAVTLRLGYIGYLYLDVEAPEPVDNQHDFLAVVKLEQGLPVKPYLGVYVDPIRYKGFYSAAGAVHSISFMNDKLSFETTLNAGVSSYEGIEFGLQDVTLFSRGEYLVTDLIYVGLTLGVAYSPRAVAGGDRFLPYALLAVGVGN